MNLRGNLLGNNPDFGWLVVGHGARGAVGRFGFHRLVDEMERQAPLPIERCFLELAPPTIDEGMAALARRGVKRVLVVPVLLFSAGHANEDVPDAVSQARERYGIELMGQSKALERHPLALEASSDCFRRVLHRSRSLQVQAPNTGLVLIGRGSSSPTATAEFLAFAQERKRMDQIDQVFTGFVAVASPTVREAFQAAEESTANPLVVQPHLLFPGRVLGDVVEEFVPHRKKSKKVWLFAAPLGKMVSIARAFVSLGIEASESSLESSR